VGHGGTLDPLASGVLVIGVGKGTKELQSYLSGSKKYKATGEFGFETTTLDLDEAGEVTKRMPYNHVTIDALQDSLSDFKGTIMQVPPIFSAIRKEGKKMYEQAREGKTAEELKLEPRQVEVYNLELVNDNNDLQLPSFELNIECGGGTYVRSLIRDIGYKLDTVATMTALERTQQGQFTSGDALEKEDWCPDNIYGAIDKVNASRENL
jgi:tRNA pseudouridine55 synthase